tara:strand:+ start:1354 stop:1557 length:204 start_codon:yes stop_codon:yes gene_type:complete
MNTLIGVIRVITINAILAIIFLALVFEEIDWAIFSSRQNINEIVIDNTSWNFKKIFMFIKIPRNIAF